MNAPCPTDDELLAAARDDAGATAAYAHAAGCEACRNRIEQFRGEVGALRNQSRAPPGSSAVTVTVPPGEFGHVDGPAFARIGRYVVMEELGSGGQANVYRVLDPDLARSLVLKLSRQAPHHDDAHRDQVIAEGRLLATLDHPGLLRVFDVGVFEARPYLVLEYVPGRNLEQCYPRERPAVRDAARLAGDVAQVLAYAHSRGVVHGDVTPRNIMIDAEGRTRLIDFGLARLESIWQDDSGPRGGTPEFLPPELLQPDGAQQIGPAADVFGLGATLYWLLSGHGPFTAPNAIEALNRARRGAVDFSAIRGAGVPRQILRLLEATLATAPARRPTAAEVARRLRRWQPVHCAGNVAALRGAIAVGVVLLAALLGALAVEWVSGDNGFRWTSRERTLVLSVPDVMVIRDNEVVNLKTVLPLYTGDRITMTFLVSPGEAVTAVWLDAQGQPYPLRLMRTPDDEVDRIRYPEAERPEQVAGPEGTVMLFICRGAPISDGELSGCFSGKAPPTIPDQVFLQLQRLSRVEPMGPIPPRSAAAEGGIL